MSVCSAVSTWSSCTGAAVWVSFSVSPSSSAGARALPGARSTKKLPSRKIRGRIRAVASLWIGRPLSAISIVTTAAVPSPASTLLTLPTSTPAIRTGEPGRSELTDSNTAFSWKPRVNGTSLAKPR